MPITNEQLNEWWLIHTTNNYVAILKWYTEKYILTQKDV